MASEDASVRCEEGCAPRGGSKFPEEVSATGLEIPHKRICLEKEA